MKGASKYLSINKLKEIQENDYKTDRLDGKNKDYYKQEVDAELWRKLGDLTDSMEAERIAIYNNRDTKKDDEDINELIKGLI